MKNGFILATLLIAGCAAAPAPEAPSPAAASGPCNAAVIQDLIGQAASAKQLAEAQRRSGAATVRQIGPGDMVTMDYREDRLNITVDNGRIVKLSCG